MSYCGYVTTLKNVRPHSNADRLQLADCFGNTVVIGLDMIEGQKVAYFPVDGQLSEEFCKVNDMVRRKDENGNNCGGYLDPVKRNIRAMSLRGEKSDGLVCGMETLDYCFDKGTADENLNIGDTITVVNGHDVCQKYIPRGNCGRRSAGSGKQGKKKSKTPIAPTFFEHADTEQLAYNLDAFKSGDQIEISLKLHGTSQRTGYLPRLVGYKRTLMDKIFRREGTPIYEYGYVSGTRRTILDTFDGGFYGSNEFREQFEHRLEGKLRKGETCYYEVVGFTHTGAPIMAQSSNDKIGKDFVKKYGKITTFSYGCEPAGSKTMYGNDDMGAFEIPVAIPQSEMYVYRMTMTNEDGEVVEYTPDFMRYRCEQMGIKCVPVFYKGYIPENPASAEDATITAGEWVKNLAERFYDGEDPIGKTHVREGVVVRIINRPTFKAYKHKNFSFKVLEGIAKNDAVAPDMEEADGLEENT